jgi:hypothetical protein
MEWDPLFKSPHELLDVDPRLELPPNLKSPPFLHKTKVPPLSTITSIAIGGKHPHVLTTNADRPSLNETIRVCPTTTNRRRTDRSPLQPVQSQGTESLPEQPLLGDVLNNETEQQGTGTNEGRGTVAVETEEHSGIVLTSQVYEVAHYLETCGLKPSFMDVDEDVIVIGTSKGDIVVLNMLSQE